jgi:hypothetical protein
MHCRGAALSRDAPRALLRLTRLHIGPSCVGLAVGKVHTDDDAVLGRSVHLYAVAHPRIAEERYQTREAEEPEWRDIKRAEGFTRIVNGCFDVSAMKRPFCPE